MKGNVEVDILNWIQEWYKNQCDGDWEHMYGVKIDNIDNPGWMVTIDLLDTDLEDKEYVESNYDNEDGKWKLCMVRDGKFEGHGDPERLVELLEEFRKWALS